MNETTITRRQAIEAGTSYLSVLILALLASAVPQAQPAPPDWLADDPELAAAFERYVRVTRLLTWDDDHSPSRLINIWSDALEAKVAYLRAAQQS